MITFEEQFSHPSATIGDIVGVIVGTYDIFNECFLSTSGAQSKRMRKSTEICQYIYI